MAWVRIHDGAMSNLKIVSLPDSTFRLWIKGLCYCQTALTDGLIPVAALASLGAKTKDIGLLATPQIEGRLPLWETHPLGFKVHDYLEWNDCRDKVLDRQRKTKDRKDAWAEKTRSETRSERVKKASSTVRFGLSSDLHSSEREEDDEFAEFWDAYPLKVGKAAALKAWRKLKPPPDRLTLLAALDWQRKQESWTKDHGKFIPHPGTWLNGARWTDERPAGPKSAYEWVCPHEPSCAAPGPCDIKRRIEMGKAG